MKLVDSHAHLDSERFEEDLDQVLERAWEGGLAAILTVGCLGSRDDDVAPILELLEKEERIFASFGVHPHDASAMTSDTLRELRNLLDHPRVVALGEVGLDFFYDNSPRDIQEKVFREQLELALEVGKPVIIHTREAEQMTIEVLSEYYSDSKHPGGILHCFSGSQELANAGLALDFHLAFGGIVTFNKADEIRKIAAAVPSNRLLIETDCPYLAPVPMRGKRNEPSYVSFVADRLSPLRDSSKEAIARATTENFQRLFRVEIGDELPEDR